MRANVRPAITALRAAATTRNPTGAGGLVRKIPILIVLAGGILSPASLSAQCRPGDHLIGEDDKQYYCSRRTCNQLADQLAQDQEALRRLQKNILDTNDELKRWTEENNAAALNAFKRAGTLLQDATLGALGNVTDSKITAVRNAITKRGPTGETFKHMVRRLQELSQRKSKLQGIAHALSLSQYPFSSLTSAWVDMKEWAKAAQHESDAISAILAEMYKDPEGAEILKENTLSFASDGLKLKLTPLLGQQLALGEFLVNYGYDATAWVKSRQLVVQNIENQEQNRIAVCKLSTQLKKTVRDQNICAGKYPKTAEVLDPANCK